MACRGFFDNALSKTGGISAYRDWSEEFGVIGIAGYSVDLTAELSVTSKTAGVLGRIRGA